MKETTPKYFYTHIFFNADSITFQGKKADAVKIAEKYNMYIKEERNGFFVLAKNAEAVIFEHDDTDQVVRQVDPRPYLIKPNTKGRLTEKKVINLVDDLNAGFVHFGELCKAVKDSEKM